MDYKNIINKVNIFLQNILKLNNFNINKYKYIMDYINFGHIYNINIKELKIKIIINKTISFDEKINYYIIIKIHYNNNLIYDILLSNDNDRYDNYYYKYTNIFIKNNYIIKKIYDRYRCTFSNYKNLKFDINDKITKNILNTNIKIINGYSRNHKYKIKINKNIINNNISLLIGYDIYNNYNIEYKYYCINKKILTSYKYFNYNDIFVVCSGISYTPNNYAKFILMYYKYKKNIIKNIYLIYIININEIDLDKYEFLYGTYFINEFYKRIFKKSKLLLNNKIKLLI